MRRLAGSTERVLARCRARMTMDATRGLNLLRVRPLREPPTLGVRTTTSLAEHDPESSRPAQRTSAVHGSACPVTPDQSAGQPPRQTRSLHTSIFRIRLTESTLIGGRETTAELLPCLDAACLMQMAIRATARATAEPTACMHQFSGFALGSSPVALCSRLAACLLSDGIALSPHDPRLFAACTSASLCKRRPTGQASPPPPVATGEQRVHRG